MESYYKRLLDNPEHYERMVKLLSEYNPTCIMSPEETLDYCIRVAMDEGDCSTGCCAAYRTNEGKVRVFLEPLIPIG